MRWLNLDMKVKWEKGLGKGLGDGDKNPVLILVELFDEYWRLVESVTV